MVNTDVKKKKKPVKRKTNAKTKPIIYTEDRVLELLKKMYDTLMDKELGKGIYFINRLLATVHLYPDVWVYWQKKYKPVSEVDVVEQELDGDKVNEIIRAIKKIEGELEDRIVTGGLCGKLQPTMAIFALKNKYKWSDKSELELAGKKEEPFILEIRGYNPEKEKEDTK